MPAFFSSSLPADVPTAMRLEGDEDGGQLYVSLLLQLGQDSSSEKHFAMTNSVTSRVQIQSFDLR